ncbi:hypothetical protein HZA86_05030 [Candidatus Uhrbacteria bacterium]|nr:hypothetical protein [Candidatus Uhrbacteria bacterium]
MSTEEQELMEQLKQRIGEVSVDSHLATAERIREHMHDFSPELVARAIGVELRVLESVLHAIEVKQAAWLLEQYRKAPGETCHGGDLCWLMVGREIADHEIGLTPCENQALGLDRCRQLIRQLQQA